MGVSPHGRFIMENLIKMDDLAIPPFIGIPETPIIPVLIESL